MAKTEQTKNKKTTTNLKKYGYNTPSKNKKVKEKVKKTSLEKYGIDNPSKSNEIKNRIKRTNMEKYGVKYSWQSNDIKKKIRQTKLKKYGNENYNNREKFEETCINKYGVKNVFEIQDVKNKIKNTNLDRYGVEYPTQCQIIKNKVIKKSLKTFYDKINDKFDDIIFLSNLIDYTGVKLNQKYKFQCKKCKNIFYDRLDDGHIPICRKCNPISYQNGQDEVLNYVKSIYNGIVLINTRSVIFPQELDIYLPEKGIAIEYKQ